MSQVEKDAEREFELETFDDDDAEDDFEEEDEKQPKEVSV